MTPDVNILVAASRSDHAHHAIAHGWLTNVLDECTRGGSVRILPMIAAGFLRLVTHPKVFPDPTPIADALAFLDAVLSSPGVEMPEIGTEWPIFFQLCKELELTGNRVPDAWIAAAVTRDGFHLVTFDRGFKRLLRPSRRTILES